jgi:hypothetical protein
LRRQDLVRVAVVAVCTDNAVEVAERAMGAVDTLLVVRELAVADRAFRLLVNEFARVMIFLLTLRAGEPQGRMYIATILLSNSPAKSHNLALLHPSGQVTQVTVSTLLF